MSTPRKGICGKCGARVPVPDEPTALCTVRRLSYDGASAWVQGHLVYEAGDGVGLQLVRCKDCGGLGFEPGE